MPTKPRSIEVRAYQVGFGDCFLVTFVYAGDEKRHVLIDFGTMELPRGTKPSEHMPRVAEHIKQACDGELAAIVATHRHADHISGFATDGRSGGSGKIIAACKPKVVLQPWTEDPRAARNARKATAGSNRSAKGFVASLSAMHRVAGEVCRMVQTPPRTMSLALAKQLQFLGADNIKNKSAVDNLIAMGSRKGATAVWAHHGSRSGLERVLPGVKVHVLGPPDLTQSEKIRKMRSTDPDEFWMLLGKSRALDAMGVATVNPLSNSAPGKRVPSEARWFRDRLAVLSGEQLLEIVRTLDDQMNNTSLILLFEIGKTKLLFPGDAQIENWSYALEDSPSAERTRTLLAGVDLYKVGHHGSRNATPKTLLWENFEKRGGPKSGRMHALLSTMSGKHGHPDKHTEVPRKTLREALENETQLMNTQEFKKGKDAPLCEKVELKVR